MGLKCVPSIAEIRANVKLVISGGQNEPRDAIAGAMLGALVMQSLQSGMVLIGVDTPLQNIVVGVVLVVTIGRVLELVAMLSTDAMHEGRPPVIVRDVGLGLMC